MRARETLAPIGVGALAVICCAGLPAMPAHTSEAPPSLGCSAAK